MLPEIARFRKWLRRRNPHAVTYRHYTHDLQSFFAWTARSPAEVTLREVDAYIEHCQQCHHAPATINRRLAALRSFYSFLALESDDAPPNPVLPKRHFIRQGRRLPRDIEDADLERFFVVVEDVRDRAMFLLMLRCGLRVTDYYRAMAEVERRLQPGEAPPDGGRLLALVDALQAGTLNAEPREVLQALRAGILSLVEQLPESGADFLGQDSADPRAGEGGGRVYRFSDRWRWINGAGPVLALPRCVDCFCTVGKANK